MQNNNASGKKSQLFSLLETKDEKEKAVIDKIIVAVKYMNRMNPSVDFQSINEMYLRIVFEYF